MSQIFDNGGFIGNAVDYNDTSSYTTVTQGLLTLEYVGGRVGNKAGATSGDTSVALNSGLTGGTASSVSAGDLVIVAYATGSTADRTLAITDPSAANYTLIGSELYANGTTNDTNLRVAYKFMGATPDASLNIGPTGNAADGGAWAIHVWRNVDQTTPLDGVTPTTATNTGTSRPDPPSITPTTAGAKVIVATGGATGTGTTAFTFANANNLIQDNGVDTQDGRASLASYDWTSGPLDPAASSTGAANAGDSWAAVSFVLRPATGDITTVLNKKNSGIWSLETVSQKTRTTPDYLNYSGGLTGDVGTTFDKPTGTVEGDLMLCALVTSGDTLTITPPSGWTKHLSEYRFGAVGQRQTYQLFWKIAGASEPATYTFSHTGGGTTYEAPIIVRVGANTFDMSNPIEASSYSSGLTTTTRVNPGVTTTVDKCTLIFFTTSWASPPSSTPTGMTAIVSPWDLMNSAFFQEGITVGPTGQKTQTQTNSDDFATVLVAIRSKGAEITPRISPVVLDAAGGVYITGASGATSTSTTAITVANNNNRCLLAWIGNNNTSTQEVTSVTWAGTTMTQVGSSIGIYGNQRLSLWRQVAPATGNNTLTINVNSSFLNSRINVFWASLYNVDQTTPLSATATNATTSTNYLTGSPTGVIYGYPLACAMGWDNDNAVTFTSDAGQTRLATGPTTTPYSGCLDTETPVNGTQTFGITVVTGARYSNELFSIVALPAKSPGIFKISNIVYP